MQDKQSGPQASALMPEVEPPTRWTPIMEQLMPNGIRRGIWLRAAYSTPANHYGVHNAEIDFWVESAIAKVWWRFSTGWHTKRTLQIYPQGYLPDGLGFVSASWELDGHRSEDGVYATWQLSGEWFAQFVVNPEAVWTLLETKLASVEADARREVAEINRQG